MTVTLPLWLALLVLLLATWSAIDRVLYPGVRWFLRRRGNRALGEINTRLKIRIPPFKLTKREVLIDRLLYGPSRPQAADAGARGTGAPPAARQAGVRPHDPE